MPTAPLRPCPGSPTCPHYAGQCPIHPKRGGPWSHAYPAKRITGRKLQRMRWNLWAKDPHCTQCKHVLLPSQMIRDHIIPLAEGGTDTDENTQPLCRTCSDLKTEREKQRGLARSR